MPLHQRREDAVMGLLYLLPINILAGCIIFLAYCRYLSNHPSNALIDLIMMFLFVPIAVKLTQKGSCLVATWARKALSQSIPVECPCCDQSFKLHATQELSPESSPGIEDKYTKEWMSQNTRPCPSCSVPVSKSGGCNHMQCIHCRCRFCWACVRPRTQCAAYQCVNGGRNASPTEQDNTTASVPTLLDRIGTLEARNPPWTLNDGLLLVVPWVLRRSVVIQQIASGLLSIFAFLLTTPVLSGAAAMYLITEHFVRLYYQNRVVGRRGGGLDAPGQQQQQPNLVAQTMALEMTERQMLQAALANSRRDR